MTALAPPSTNELEALSAQIALERVARARLDRALVDLSARLGDLAVVAAAPERAAPLLADIRADLDRVLGHGQDSQAPLRALLEPTLPALADDLTRLWERHGRLLARVNAHDRRLSALEAALVEIASARDSLALQLAEAQAEIARLRAAADPADGRR